MRIAALAADRLAADDLPLSILKTKPVADLDKELGGLLALKPNEGVCSTAIEAHTLDARAVAARDEMRVLLEMVLEGLLHRLPLCAVASTEYQREQANCAAA